MFQRGQSMPVIRGSNLRKVTPATSELRFKLITPHMKPTLALRSFLLGSAIAALLTFPAAFAGNTWDGGGGTGLWNTDSNWNSDTAPSTGTALTFAGNVQNSTSNDLVAVDPSFAGIRFTNSVAASNINTFTMAGSRITLGGNITTTANVTLLPPALSSRHRRTWL